PLGAAARLAGRSLADLDLVVAVSAELTTDNEADIEAAARRHAAGYAFTFGAMGSRASNFYNNPFARQGFGDDVAGVQRLGGEAAAARVPVEIGLRTNLIGPPEVIRMRLRAYRDCGVTTLRVSPVAASLGDRVTTLGTLVDLACDVNAAR